MLHFFTTNIFLNTQFFFEAQQFLVFIFSRNALSDFFFEVFLPETLQKQKSFGSLTYKQKAFWV